MSAPKILLVDEELLAQKGWWPLTISELLGLAAFAHMERGWPVEACKELVDVLLIAQVLKVTLHVDGEWLGGGDHVGEYILRELERRWGGRRRAEA